MEVYALQVIGPSRLHRYTYADYVSVELTSSTKHEFLNGEIYPMVGGSEEHSALCAQVLRPSLEEYIVVSHRARRITVHHRSGRGWDTTVAVAGAVPVISLATTLAVDDVYRGSAIG